MDMGALMRKFHTGPLGQEIIASIEWAKTVTFGSIDSLELFLNPVDVDGLPHGWTLYGYQLRRSIGVPPGKCLVFDRRVGRYIRRGERPTP
ncbi:hypothetical protein ACWEQC_22095 [Streptomyces shenzhenensis]